VTASARAASLASALAFVGVACGGAARPANAPEDTEPQTIEEAQTRIEVATHLIESSATTTAQPAQPPTSPPSGKALGAEPGWGAENDTNARNDVERTRPCDTSCRAIVSMRRAVSALCRLAGEEDSLCADARRTLADGVRRVASCGCAAAGLWPRRLSP
jgi:hypothetical protein